MQTSSSSLPSNTPLPHRGMAQEYKYISLRDILKKEKLPNLSFFECSPSESEVESDYPSAKAMAMPTPSPFAIANSSDESSGLNSSMGREEETKRISDKHLFSKNCNNSGTVYKGKLLAGAPISSLKNSKSEDEEEKQMKKEEEEEPHVDADKEGKGSRTRAKRIHIIFTKPLKPFYSSPPMAQEYKCICLRDILKKEKFPKLSFFKYSPSESEVESDYPSAKAMEMPKPSPLAIANFSAQVGERVLV
ncbi:Hypothetical predicted protein [Olea europaea subsp. europaea]|uniref:Uncharacterized protein n=1 Tax=Olea europaea subsp. europaea TaxID=158383 RepID=A0A8S0QXE9_OLEEU|nr:Hypothetical predicted protein [Olea europaea subsp. europaea]